MAIGDKIVCYGGSLEVTSDLCVLDVSRRKWIDIQVWGKPPYGRQSAQAWFMHGWMWIWGGFSPSYGEFGDLELLQLFDAAQPIDESEYTGTRADLRVRYQNHTLVVDNDRCLVS